MSQRGNSGVHAHRNSPNDKGHFVPRESKAKSAHHHGGHRAHDAHIHAAPEPTPPEQAGELAADFEKTVNGTYLEKRAPFDAPQFYLVNVKGDAVMLRWGTCGGKANSKVKTFGCGTEAEDYARAQVRQKEKDGYSPAACPPELDFE